MGQSTALQVEYGDPSPTLHHTALCTRYLGYGGAMDGGERVYPIRVGHCGVVYTTENQSLATTSTPHGL